MVSLTCFNYTKNKKGRFKSIKSEEENHVDQYARNNLIVTEYLSNLNALRVGSDEVKKTIKGKGTERGGTSDEGNTTGN